MFIVGRAARNAALKVRTHQRGYASINCSISREYLCLSSSAYLSTLSQSTWRGDHACDRAEVTFVGLGNSSPTLRRICFIPPSPTACHIPGHLRKNFVLPLLSAINLSCPHRQPPSCPIKLPGPNEMPCKKSNRPESLREGSRMQKRLPVSWLLG
jgi:hypothetical protein